MCLINEALLHGDVWGNGGTATPFLTSAAGSGDFLASGTNRFNPETDLPLPTG